MIRYLIAAVLAMPAVAGAQYQFSTKAPSQDDVQRHCLIEGNAFYQAAAYRDDGISPQQTLGLMRRAHYEGIDDVFLKRAINAVYFDPAFVNAGGQPLMMQMAQQCMHPNGVYKPLE